MVAAAIAAAWARWRRFHAPQGGCKVLGVAEREAQFELVATGLVLTQEQVQEQFQDDAEAFVALLNPLPRVGEDVEEEVRFHFTLVAAAVLLDQFLQSSEQQKEQATSLLRGKLVGGVLLPVLQRERYASLHHAALGMIQTLLQLSVQCGDAGEVVRELFQKVEMLVVEREDDIDEVEDVAVSYGSLCSLLELLLRQKMDGKVVDKLVELSMEICEHATKTWKQYPSFLRAVVLHIVPAILEVCVENDKSKVNLRLLSMVMNAWEKLQTASNGVVFPQELLYLVCIIMPQSPRELIADKRLQQLVCYALRNNDSLLRKQGLHVLRIAFSHCAPVAEPPTSNSKRNNSKKQEPLWVNTWQNFFTASEVIQMHHEQHLIEQVWPQVDDLLTSFLIIPAELKQEQEDEQWSVELTFEWMQSLLGRLFAHDNPVVKRMFISNFMETCVKAWTTWGNQRTSSQGADHIASFACTSAFQNFVLVDLLRACNDPVLYKQAHRARFQTIVVDFLVSFLAFQFFEGEKENLLDEFVEAIDEAIFGDNSDSHSPEALLSMLQVFQSSKLKHAASSASAKMLLSATAVDRLRFLLDVHAMQSFSQAMRMKMQLALAHALTGGYINVAALSMSTLARVLIVFTTSSLVNADGEILLLFLRWIKTSPAANSSFDFLPTLSTVLQAYLKPQADRNDDDILSSSQLARLLLFTADIIADAPDGYDQEGTRQIRKTSSVILKSSLSSFLSEIPKHELNSSRLVILVAKFEHEVQELTGNGNSRATRTGFSFSFQRDTFYEDKARFSYLFDSAMSVVRVWSNNAVVVRDAAFGDHEKEETMERITAAVFVLSQLSTYTMNSTGDLKLIAALDALCEDLKNILVSAASRTIFDLSLAARCLCIVGNNGDVVDSLQSFETDRILPLLLALDTSRRYSGRLDARCAINLAADKWVLLHHIVEASSFIDTKVLRATYDACIEALPTAGMDPSALMQMVNVLSLTLSQLAVPLANGSNGIELLDSLLEEVWAAYSDSKAKPDALTRAVVVCMFQPVFLLRAELAATMKHWIAEFIRFGSRHRPNVIFHLTCRLCQTWRAHPASALRFADELVGLLLYKEPLIDEKEQLTVDANVPFQGFQGFSPVSDDQVQKTAAIGGHAKERFVRLVVLNFLDDVAVESSASTSETQQLMNALLIHLLELNASPDWQKQHMLNSDGFGKKLRSWQALCIISAHVTKLQFTELLPSLRTAFAVPQLPSVRYYMELFGMRMTTKFPHEICSGLLLPMLGDANLMPQVGASLLLVSAYLANYKLDDSSPNGDCGELIETMLPWLNTSHGYTRVLAQFLLAKVLPRHIHQLRLASSDTPGLRFLEGTAHYLSNNKECKRMLRRQARQLEEFHPDYESSLLGMLSSGFISEFGELLPRDEALRFSEQLKTAMNDLYAQYQLENFTPASSSEKNDVAYRPAFETGGGALTVQRKIDTSALLLEDSALPAAMRADFDAARRGDTLNARQQPRQPIIMCASLVDKIPNLAGLARTCEIFNAQKLIVPNLRLVNQDVTFATVSATAHKWMPLEEVRPQGDDLRQALLRWKSEGYAIVAVEQTASSVSLTDYTLPRKMVLVLGREKEGIPVDVLQLVDVCVEIPQFGLVRSLNVHVSGALMLWEYTQQQIMSGALQSTL